jgi:hypothetical protein
MTGDNRQGRGCDARIDEGTREQESSGLVAKFIYANGIQKKSCEQSGEARGRDWTDCGRSARAREAVKTVYRSQGEQDKTGGRDGRGSGGGEEAGILSRNRDASAAKVWVILVKKSGGRQGKRDDGTPL